MLELFQSRVTERNKVAENGTFIELMKENWRQVRHNDSIRIGLAVIYAALFAATLAYVVYKGGNLKAQQTIVLFIPLLLVSMVWVPVTLRINADIDNCLYAIRNAFTEGKITISDKEQWFRFMGMPLAMASGINRWFTTGNYLIAFYTAVGLGSIAVIMIAAF